MLCVSVFFFHCVVLNLVSFIFSSFFSSVRPSVVYEHRSRLEKSLQKERVEHKKAKEGNPEATKT